MFENILQPVFSEKPNNLLLKARIYMPTHIGSPRAALQQNFPPNSKFGYQMDSALGSSNHLSQKDQQKSYTYI